MKQIIGIIIMIGFLACQENKQRIESIEKETLTAEQVDSILTAFKFQYESPIIVDSTDQILIPISTELLERRKMYSKDEYYSDEYPRYWNVLFYNRKTGETRLLTEDKIRISQIHVSQNEYQEIDKTLNKKVLYQISNIDFNMDNKLNDLDPEFLFISEINGENLKRISPQNEHLQYFEVIPQSGQILIRTLRDVNQDSIFNGSDESIWYKAEVSNNDWLIAEIIDSTQRKKIENLYFNQWLKKK